MTRTSILQCGIVHNRPVSDTAYELRLERDGLAFIAGQLINLSGPGERDQRDYTIASGVDDPWLDVLYRLVEHGALTPQMVGWQAGSMVPIGGPYGSFTLRDPERPVVFIATGTGIAPCRSFVRSHPGLNLQVLHGVRHEADLFYRDELERHAYTPCISGDAKGDGFYGRVTDFLDRIRDRDEADFYLCGANEMIYEVQAQLSAGGVSHERIFTEPYYYRLDA